MLMWLLAVTCNTTTIVTENYFLSVICRHVRVNI